MFWLTPLYLDASIEWDNLLTLVNSASSEEAKERVKEGLVFVHSQVVSAIKVELHTIEENESTIEDNERAYFEFESLLRKIEDEYREITQGQLSKLNTQVR